MQNGEAAESGTTEVVEIDVHAALIEHGIVATADVVRAYTLGILRGELESSASAAAVLDTVMQAADAAEEHEKNAELAKDWAWCVEHDAFTGPGRNGGVIVSCTFGDATRETLGEAVKVLRQVRADLDAQYGKKANDVG